MIQSINQSNPIARKDYYCDCCQLIRDSLPYIKFAFADLRKIVRARQDGWMIKKGNKYEYQFNTDGGDAWTFRGRLDMYELCNKYDLFDD